MTRAPLPPLAPRAAAGGRRDEVTIEQVSAGFQRLALQLLPWLQGLLAAIAGLLLFAAGLPSLLLFAAIAGPLVVLLQLWLRQAGPVLPILPAYLLIPKDALSGKKNVSGILCPHPTDNNIGHKVVVGLGGKANRQYAAELAERGFVTLAPSYPLLANYQPDLKALGWESGTLKAVWDNIRGLDLLESLPFVNAKAGFGTIGHSLGGHNSVYTAVFDQRIKVIVSSCGLDSYLDYYGGNPKNWEPERGWCQTRYMLKLAGYHGRLEEIPFDFHEMIGALAPRMCFINAPLKDSNFKWDSVDRVVAAASHIYKLHGQPGNLLVEHPDCDHDFPDAMREKAYRLFEQHLR